ncbi:MAG: hypothetical protein LBT05_11935 [Planctomycetaceae bacterium]|jgi:hypothetical protein|nr:hypothetical protein [Planctomycetaceae bacterium]
MRRIYLKTKHKIKIGENVIAPYFGEPDNVVFHAAGQEIRLPYEKWIPLGNARICFQRGRFIIIDGSRFEILPPKESVEKE